MLTDHAKLMKVFASAGEVIGRKKLQKMVYIAKKLNYPFYEKYNFHFYGPYSEEVTLRVEELCNLGFLSELKENKGGYSQYRYSLTENGEEFLTHYDLELPHLNECMTKMNEQSSRFLELVSTVLFFENLPPEEVKEKVFTLKSKQRYTEEEVDEAYEYIESLRACIKQ
ncbi:YwgA family protein [Sutcliffiella horikoshii]|uniref:YwgA family protein n=1 Tax=Sutcliffiella horikoshii TaxID=79883 RepID=UPI0007D0491E|nr:YwgA family protein [Sutcliffiella horikoshii]MCM3618035.1 YwgA family protein [Sutcliffiella horikoshii]